MVANLDITDGKVNFASHREPAWHGLGTVFQEEVTDYRLMLVKANLAGWDVRLRDLDSDARRETETFEVIRTNPTDGLLDRLGVVGARYVPIQNEDSFAFLQSLADGASWETAGAIQGGALVFGSIAFDREIVLDPNGVSDKIKTYLLVTTSHNGTIGVQAMNTAVRVVCQNTWDMAVKGAKQMMKIRHTQKADERMRVAAETWRNANTYFDAVEREAAELYATPFADTQYTKLVTEVLFPKPEADKKGAVKKWENRVEINMQPWKSEANAGIRGTAWGAVNALTEAAQWGRQLRGRDADGEITDAAIENFLTAGAGLDGPTKEFRNKALLAVKALA